MMSNLIRWRPARTNEDGMNAETLTEQGVYRMLKNVDHVEVVRGSSHFADFF